MISIATDGFWCPITVTTPARGGAPAPCPPAPLVAEIAPETALVTEVAPGKLSVSDLTGGPGKPTVTEAAPSTSVIELVPKIVTQDDED